MVMSISCWSFDGECTYCSHLFQNVNRVENFTLIVVEYTIMLMHIPARKLKEEKVWETVLQQCSTSCISSPGDVSKQECLNFIEVTLIFQQKVLLCCCKPGDRYHLQYSIL